MALSINEPIMNSNQLIYMCVIANSKRGWYGGIAQFECSPHDLAK